MMRHKKRRTAPEGVKLLLLGTLYMALSFFLFAIAFSFIAYSMPDPLSYIGIFSIISLMASAAVSGFIEGRIGRAKGVAYALLSSLFFSLLALLGGLIMGGGAVPVGCIINYLLYIALATLFSLIGVRTRGKRAR